MAKSFTFNGINSKTYGINLESYTIGTPAKRKTEVTVPFRSGTLDFSTFFTGENTFNDRAITIKFNVVCKSNAELKVKYNRIMQWLIDTNGKVDLVFDDSRGYIFKAEVTNSISYEEFYTAGSFTVNMTASPFRESVDYQGHLITWDNFNFLEDVLSASKWEVSQTQAVVHYTSSKKVVPKIKVSKGSVKLTNNGYTTATLGVGEHIDYNFYLNYDKNDITITTSTASVVELIYKKEAI